jgi:hypothetical protein
LRREEEAIGRALTRLLLLCNETSLPPSRKTLPLTNLPTDLSSKNVLPALLRRLLHFYFYFYFYFEKDITVGSAVNLLSHLPFGNESTE